jgi:hypothetical protein
MAGKQGSSPESIVREIKFTVRGRSYKISNRAGHFAN